MIHNQKIILFLHRLIEVSKNGNFTWKNDGQDTAFDVELSNTYKVKLTLINYQTSIPVFALTIIRGGKTITISKIFSGTQLYDTTLKLYDLLYMRQIEQGIKKLESEDDANNSVDKKKSSIMDALQIKSKN